MLSILLASAVYVTVVLADLLPKRNGDKKAFWLSAILLGLSYTLWVLNGLSVKIPSPADPIEALVRAVFHLPE